MSLSDALAAGVRPPRPKRCGVCDWLAQQSDEDRATFESWLDSNKPAAELYRACRNIGLPIGRTVFGDHIRECH